MGGGGEKDNRDGGDSYYESFASGGGEGDRGGGVGAAARGGAFGTGACDGGRGAGGRGAYAGEGIEKGRGIDLCTYAAETQENLGFFLARPLGDHSLA